MAVSILLLTRVCTCQGNICSGFYKIKSLLCVSGFHPKNKNWILFLINKKKKKKKKEKNVFFFFSYYQEIVWLNVDDEWNGQTVFGNQPKCFLPVKFCLLHISRRRNVFLLPSSTYGFIEFNFFFVLNRGIWEKKRGNFYFYPRAEEENQPLPTFVGWSFTIYKNGIYIV